MGAYAPTLVFGELLNFSEVLTINKMPQRFNRVWLVSISIVILILLYYVPPIHSRLAWRLEALRTNIKYMVKPPEEAVFQPTEQAQVNLAVTNCDI